MKERNLDLGPLEGVPAPDALHRYLLFSLLSSLFSDATRSIVRPMDRKEEGRYDALNSLSFLLPLVEIIDNAISCHMISCTTWTNRTKSKRR